TIEHLAVDRLGVGGEDRERGGEFAAQRAERHADVRRNLGKADLLERLLGEQPHEARDDAITIAAGRAHGRAGFRAGGLFGHVGLLYGLAELTGLRPWM